MADEGEWSCSSRLSDRMKYSLKTGVVWKGYEQVDAGREARNDLAHRQLIQAMDATFRWIEPIENELIGWNILNGPVAYPGGYNISRTS
jgi:hypothetical protein